MQNTYLKYLRTVLAFIAIIATIFIVIFLFNNYTNNKKVSPGNQNASTSPTTGKTQFTGTYPVHKDIIASEFWVGELADNANDFISNKASAWDENWIGHYGGEDNPKDRNGYLPSGFTPKENPFYFALPYNDFDSQGDRKPQAFDIIYWAEEKNWTLTESMCKNQWIKISKDGLNVYAQWEDVGPFEEDDSGYVFGKAIPKNTEKSGAGLDVSPAVSDYLKLTGNDNVVWQFVPENEVPDGPWKQVVTTRNGN